MDDDVPVWTSSSAEVNARRCESSTGKALSVLDCFSRTRTHLTLSEIARMLGRPISSTHRNLNDLCAWGALERSDGGRYRIGMRLWEIGCLAPRGTELRHVGVPFLEDLYEATHENVQLAVLDEDEVVYLERIFSHQATPIIARPGVRLPALVTGVGRVLLSYGDPALINASLRKPLPRLTSGTMTDPNELRKELAIVKRDGYAISDRQVDPISISIAAPVYYGRRSNVVAAMSIIAPSFESAVQRYLPAVLIAARGMSRALGQGRGIDA